MVAKLITTDYEINGRKSGDDLKARIVHLGEFFKGWKANAIVVQYDTILFAFAVVVIELVRAMTRTRGVAFVVAAASSVLVAVVAVTALRGAVGRAVAFSWREWPDATLLIYAGSLVLAASVGARVAVGVVPWRRRRHGTC